MIQPFRLEVAYLIASALVILGLRGLSSPETARRGMFQAELGFLVAIVGTLLYKGIVTYTWIFAAMAIGTAIGVPMAIWIPMTAVPQRTALSHSLGALAVGLIGVSEYYTHALELGPVRMAALGMEVILGFLTFTASLQAAAKFQGLMRSEPITYKGQNIFNITLFVVMVAIVVYLLFNPSAHTVFYLLVGLSLAFGFFLVLPIGAADMPVVMTLLNSYGGLADASMGFLLGNRIHIVVGSLDGSSGFVLSILMSRAMNRSFANVFFGAFGKVAAPSGEVAAVAHGESKKITVEEAVALFKKAKSIIIVPGYGMAASRAHYPVRELADLLKARGIGVKYAIHPVAGRMPGHMNVLLAEADVPYTELIDMDEINPEFPSADVALVLGANDVTNPAARHDQSSPIYGMPILDVDKAKTVIVCKRSMNPGFAGIENELYYMPQTSMLFGDGKATAEKLVQTLKTAG